MRFNPTPEETRMVPIRLSISAELEAKYKAAAAEAKTDLTTVLRQALIFAAGDEPASEPPQTFPARKPRRKSTEG